MRFFNFNRSKKELHTFQNARSGGSESVYAVEALEPKILLSAAPVGAVPMEVQAASPTAATDFDSLNSGAEEHVQWNDSLEDSIQESAQSAVNSDYLFGQTESLEETGLAGQDEMLVGEDAESTADEMAGAVDESVVSTDLDEPILEQVEDSILPDSSDDILPLAEHGRQQDRLVTSANPTESATVAAPDALLSDGTSADISNPIPGQLVEANRAANGPPVAGDTTSTLDSSLNDVNYQLQPTVDGSFSVSAVAGVESTDSAGNRLIVSGDSDTDLDNIDALTAEEANRILQEALLIWSQTDLPADLASRLEEISIRITELPQGVLGEANGFQIDLDTTAAGFGWFVDSTPSEDGEFLSSDDLISNAASGSAAEGRVDLLTVLVHEIGHVLGQDHESGLAVMAEELPIGKRIALNADVEFSISGEGPVSDFVITGTTPNQTLDLSADISDLTIIFNSDGSLTVSGATIAADNDTFTGITSIITGSGMDTFVFDGGIFAGSINAGAGDVRISLAGLVTLSGSFTFGVSAINTVKLAGDPVTDVSVHVLELSGSGTMFMGAEDDSGNQVGLTANVSAGVVLIQEVGGAERFWTAAKGTLSGALFLNIDGVDLTVNDFGLTLELYQAAADGTLVDFASNPLTLGEQTLNQSVKLLKISGTLAFGINDFVRVAGDFAFGAQIDVSVDDGAIAAFTADVLTISVTNAYFFVGDGAGNFTYGGAGGALNGIDNIDVTTAATAGASTATGFYVENANLAIAIVTSTESAGTTVDKSWVGISASVGTMTVVGIDPNDFSAAIKNLTVLFNVADKGALANDVSDDTKLNWDNLSTDTVDDGTAAVVSGFEGLFNTLDFKVSGYMTLSISSFVQLRGAFAMSKQTGLNFTPIATATNLAPVAKSVSVMTIGFSDVDVFVGDGPYFTETNLGVETTDPDATGLLLKDVSLALALFKPTSSSDTSSYYAVSARAGRMELVGMSLGGGDSFTLDASGYRIEINGGKDGAGNPSAIDFSKYTGGQFSVDNGTQMISFDYGSILQKVAIENALLVINDFLHVTGGVSFARMKSLPVDLSDGTENVLMDGFAFGAGSVDLFAGNGTYFAETNELLELFDTDKNGSVTVGELRVLNGQTAASATEYAQIYTTTDAASVIVDLQVITTVLDADSNGILTLEEAEAFLADNTLAVSADVNGDEQLDSRVYTPDEDAGATGLALENVDFGLVMLRDPNAKSVKYTALKATADFAGIVGVDVFKLEASNIEVNYNSSNNAAPKENVVVNFSGAGNELTIDTGSGSIDIDSGTKQLEVLIGKAVLQIDEYVYIEGSFAFEKGAPLSNNHPLSGGGNVSVPYSVINVGADDVTMFFGVGGPYWTDLDGDGVISWTDADGNTLTQAEANSDDTIIDADETFELNENAVGVAITNASLALALFSPTGNSSSAVKYIALKATAQQLGFVGADVFQVEGSTIAVSLNIASGSGVTSTTPVLDFSGELLGLFDANADGVITVGELRVLNGVLADSSTAYNSANGDLYVVGDDKDDEVSLNDIVRILDTTGEGVLSVAEAQVFLDDDTLATAADASGNNTLERGAHEVATGNGGYVYFDEAQRRITASADQVLVKVADFLYVKGSVAFDLGSRELVTIKTGIPDAFGRDLSSIRDTINTALADLTTTLDTLEADVQAAIETAFNDLLGSIDGLVDDAVNAIVAAIQNSVADVKGAVDSAISSGLDRTTGGMAATIDGLLNTFVKAITDPITNNTVKSLVSGLLSPIQDLIAGLFGDLLDGALNSIISRLGSALSEGIDTAGATAAAAAVQFGAQIKSSITPHVNRIKLELAKLVGKVMGKLEPVISKLKGIANINIGDNFGTLENVEVEVTTIGIGNGTAFIGLAPEGGFDYDSDESLADQAATGATGLLIENFTMGLGMFKPVLSQVLPSFTALKVTADTASFIIDDGDGDPTTNFLKLSAETINVELNLGGPIVKGLSGVFPNAAIDFIASFPDTDGAGSDKPGFEVATGTTTDPVVLDFLGDEIIRASIKVATIQVSDNVYITGSVALEKGAIQTFDVTDGALPISEIASELSELGITIPSAVSIPATGAKTTEVSILTIGGSNVRAFVGMNGPYWTDLDGDGEISWALADGTPQTQAQVGSTDAIVDVDETAELSADAVGLFINDFDFGLALLKPSLAVDPSKYYALKGSADLISLVGMEGVTLKAQQLLVELNLSSPTVYGLSLLPVINFASTFDKDERQSLFNAIAKLDTSGDNTKISAAEMTIAFGGNYSVTDDLTKADELVDLLLAGRGPPANGISLASVLGLLDADFKYSNDDANENSIRAFDADQDGLLSAAESSNLFNFIAELDTSGDDSEVSTAELITAFGSDFDETVAVTVAADLVDILVDGQPVPNEQLTIEKVLDQLTTASKASLQASLIALDLDGDGKFDPIGFEVNTGNDPVYFAMDSSLIRAQGAVELNILDTVILAGSVAFELGPTESVTLADGSAPKQVTTMTIGAANVSAFIGALDSNYWTDNSIADGAGYWTDLDGDQEVSWTDKDGNTRAQADADTDGDGVVDIDETFELNDSAVGFHVTDLDVGILLMAATDPADLGVYLAAKLNVFEFGLVGITDLTATGAFDIELNVGFGASGAGPSIGAVDFTQSFSEAVGLFALLNTTSDTIIDQAEQAAAFSGGATGVDITSVAQLVSYLNATSSTTPPDDKLLISEVLAKLKDPFKADNLAAINALDEDGNDRLNIGFEVNTGNSASPVVLDFDDFLISIQLGGELELVDTFRMYGVFIFEVDTTGLKAFVAAGIEIGPDIGNNSKIFNMNALGALVINADGVAADIQISVSIGGALSDVLQLNATARLVFNTTGKDQLITIPAKYVQFILGQDTIAASESFDTTLVSGLTLTQAEFESRFTRNPDSSATYTISAGAPNEPPGFYLLATFNGSLTIAGAFVITADFRLLLTGQKFELGFTGTLGLSGFGTFNLSGGGVIDGNGFAAYGTLQFSFGDPSLLEIEGAATLQINTGDALVAVPTGVPGQTFNIASDTYKVALTANVTLFNFINGSGNVEIGVSNGIFEIAVNQLNIDLFILDVDISGYIRSNGQFNLTGSLSLPSALSNGEWGITGAISVNISNSGFTGSGNVGIRVFGEGFNIASATLSITSNGVFIRAEGPLSVYIEVTVVASGVSFDGGLGFFDDLVAAVGVVATAVGEAVVEGATVVAGAFEDLGEGILNLGEDIGGAIGGFASDVAGAISDVAGAIGEFLSSTRTNANTYPPAAKYSYSSSQATDGTLTINMDGGALTGVESRLAFAVVNGQLIVDGPDATRSVKIADRQNQERDWDFWDVEWGSWYNVGGAYGAVYHNIVYSNLKAFDNVTRLVVNGTNGADTIVMDTASINMATTVYGKNGADTIITGNGRDYVEGGRGNDIIYTYGGNDTVYGDSLSNSAYSGNDVIVGGTGNDTLYGGPGDDFLNENYERGNDSNILLSEVNILDGGSGNDLIVGSPGRDTITAGDGEDTITGLNNEDTYIFNNNYGTDVYGDFYGITSIDLSGVTESLVVSISDSGFSASTLSGDSLVIEGFIGIGQYSDYLDFDISEIKIGLGDDVVTITALPQYRMDIIDAGGNDTYDFDLDVATAAQSVARVHINDSNGNSDRIELGVDSTGFDIYLHPLEVLLNNLHVSFTADIEFLDLTDVAATTKISTSPSGPTELLVKSGVTITSTTLDGPIELIGRLDFTLEAGALITTTGGVIIRADQENQTGSTGAVIDILGIINAANVDVFGADGNDTVNLAYLNSGPVTNIRTSRGSDTINIRKIDSATTVYAGDDDDTINIGSLAPTTTGGNLNGFNANLYIYGDGGSDILNVDDSGDTIANTGTLTSTQITGLGMSAGVTYDGINNLNIRLGQVADVFTIESTHSAVTNLYGNAGGNIINIQTIAGATNVDAGTGSDFINVGSNASGTVVNPQNNSTGNLNGISALLTINGNLPTSGSDTLTIDDTGDNSPNTGTLTSTQITGLGMVAGISYSAIEHLIISLGDGGNTFTIVNTHGAATASFEEDTTVNTGDGADAVLIVDTTDNLVLNTEGEDDVISVRTVSGTTTVNAGSGDDAIGVTSDAANVAGGLNLIGGLVAHGTLDGITGTLAVHAGSGENSLLVSDFDSTTGDTGLITSNSISGFMAGLITYDAVGGNFNNGLVVWAGKSRDTVNINSILQTGQTITRVYLNEGDDSVTVTLAADPAAPALSDPLTPRRLDLFGQEGNDALVAANASLGIRAFGGAGKDALIGGSASDILYGGADADTIMGGGEADYLYGEDLTGSTTSNDVLVGDFGRAVLESSGVVRSLITSNVTPIVDVNGGSQIRVDDVLTEISTGSSGVSGNDTIDAGGGDNVVIGGAGADTLTAGIGTNTIIGDEGLVTNDVIGNLILAESTNVTVGSEDIMNLGSGTYRVIAGAGDEVIGLGAGTNYVIGDVGRLRVNPNSTISFESFAPEVAGNDTITASEGYNVIIGGSGLDIITVQSGPGIVDPVAFVLGDHGSLNLSTTGQLLSIESTEFAYGGRDVITLAAGTNTVIGGLGADKITALAGTNTIIGDAGKAEFLANGSLRLIESLNLGVGSNDEITLSDGINHVIAGLGADVINVGGGRNFVHGDEGKLEVLTDGSETTLISTLNASAGTATDIDDIDIGAGYNVVLGGAAGDTIDVNGTATGAASSILGDNGAIVLQTSTGVLLSIESTDFAFGARDVINLSAGTNAVIGGAGADEITALAGTNTILGDEGRAEFFTDGSLSLIESINLGVGANDEITLSDGINHVIAGLGADVINVGGGRNFVHGDEGKLEVLTDGSDTTLISTLNASAGTATDIDDIDIGAGYNVVLGGAAGDTIDVNGTAADAVSSILGDNGAIVLQTSTGVLLSIESTDFDFGARDLINLSAGTNAVIGGVGADLITALAGQNTILGDDGRAQFFADGSLRLIESINLGVGSNDEITLSGGVNHVIAGLGADVIDLAAGRNFVHGDEARLEVLTDGSDTTIMSTLNASGSTGNNVDDVDIRTGYNVVFGGVDGDVIDVNDTAVDSVTTIVGDNGSLVYVTSTDVLLTIESTDFDFGGRDLINLATGTNNVIAGAAGDRVTGQSGTNTVLGDDGKAEFFTDGRLRQIESINLAMGGDDGIIFSDGNNNVIGGFGDDLIQGGLSTDVVLGDNGIAYFPTPGRLYEIATNAPAIGGIDDIDGGAGRDTLIGGAAGDLVRGGSDTDFILGDDGFVIFMTDPLFDRIPEIVKTTNPYAASDDVLYGDAGNDWIFGGPGHDEIDGGSGPDVLLGDNACYIRGSVTQGEVTFLFEFDTGVSGGDTIRGGSGNDLIYGQAGPDSLYGEAGEDSLFGGIGRDYINGGTEGDILVGGLGADFLDSGSPEHDIYFVDLYDTWVGYFDTDAIIVGDDVTTQIDWTLFSGMISVEGASRWMHALENVREQVVLSDFDNGLAGYSDEMGSLIGNLGTQSAFEDYRWVVLHRGGMEDGLGALRSEWDSTFLIGIGSYLEARTFWTGQIGW